MSKFNIFIDGALYCDPFTSKVFKEERLAAEKIAFMLKTQGFGKKIEVVEA